MSRETLSKDIWRACDIMRRDNNCGGVMEYVEHLAWLLFLRFLDTEEDIFESEARIASRRYQRVLDGDYRWSAWARKDWGTGDLLRFVHGELIPHLRSLTGSSEREIIRGVFTDRNVVVCASEFNLKDVIHAIDEIDFTNPDDIHTVSFVYEDLLKKLGSENRLAGEFYTPRPIIRFIVDLINPTVGDTVYDPACGTCGFLVEAYLHMKEQERDTRDYERLQLETFIGQEKKPVPALLGLMNMVLHGVLTPTIRRRNTLEEDIREVSERFDVVITNPPFGGKESRQIQRNFPVQSQATELLFLQHIMKKLKPSGRCGLVVPEGTLFRGGVFADVKRDLFERFKLHTVISLPPGTFAPYSDVKTALLFFDRQGPTDEIWFHELPLPEGLKKFSKGNPIQDEHLAKARELWNTWNAYREGIGVRPEATAYSWIVASEDIKTREFDLTARNPNRPETEALLAPIQIVASLMEKEREILSIVEELDELLSNQLELEGQA